MEAYVRIAQVPPLKKTAGMPERAMEEKKSNDIGRLRRSQLTKAAYKVVSRKGYYNFTIKDSSTGSSAVLRIPWTS